MNNDNTFTFDTITQLFADTTGEVLDTFLNTNNVPINDLHKNGVTLLMYALGMNEEGVYLDEVATVLYRHGAEIRSTDSDNYNTFQRAILSCGKCPKFIKAVIADKDKNCDVLNMPTTDTLEFPIELAARLGDVDTVENMVRGWACDCALRNVRDGVRVTTGEKCVEHLNKIANTDESKHAQAKRVACQIMFIVQRCQLEYGPHSSVDGMYSPETFAARAAAARA